MPPEWIPPVLLIAAALSLRGLAILARRLIPTAPVEDEEEEPYDPRDDWGYAPRPPRRDE